ncbi:phosphatidylglycerophosphatase [Halostagnicola sp. A56]|uniref:phosphatase PAP2 family protein n=1 Tax=Halostagnicola sp. A56 TaxID=1495067 RepID=UPI00049F1E05|nr:phosphatase PAP2 family protein [Halostagnicola sp. A56]KDE60602.1 phosphatidylglycerophosphatase [Halostagnicola sp. A56]
MLREVLTEVFIVVVTMLAIAIPLIIGFDRIRTTWYEWRSRIRTSLPVIALLVVVMLFNRYGRQTLTAMSREYGVDMTTVFYELEGDFITVFQAFDYTILIQFFSFIYIYAYVFLLVFPVLAYFALSDNRPFRQLLTAYALNYSIGVLIYFLVIAFGPRNVMPELFDTVLYDFQPRYQHLTREVNDYRNVFPSLHTSMAVTVGIFALRTRDEYPLWVPIALFLAICVPLSTMYLAIHWAIDVVAGTFLAIFCVYVSAVVVERWGLWKRSSEYLPTLAELRGWLADAWVRLRSPLR